MKPRHAAALALVGWYIIGPPVRQPKTEPYLDEHAPYSEWKILRTASDQAQCEYGRVVLIQNLQDELTKFGNQIGPWAEQWFQAECIASDDPRLKPK
jgi:hypothetical protein